MNELRGEIIVNGQNFLYWWWSVDATIIPATHMDELKKQTEKIITEVTQMGYFAGISLRDVYDEDLKCVFEYKGGWSSVE
jgi:hypothetical protein